MMRDSVRHRHKAHPLDAYFSNLCLYYTNNNKRKLILIYIYIQISYFQLTETGTNGQVGHRVLLHVALVHTPEGDLVQTQHHRIRGKRVLAMERRLIPALVQHVQVYQLERKNLKKMEPSDIQYSDIEYRRLGCIEFVHDNGRCNIFHKNKVSIQQ